MHEDAIDKKAVTLKVPIEDYVILKRIYCTSGKEKVSPIFVRIVHNEVEKLKQEGLKLTVADLKLIKAIHTENLNKRQLKRAAEARKRNESSCAILGPDGKISGRRQRFSH